MPVKIRLQRKGRKQRPYYHIVVADARAPRDGKYIQRIGSYNPLTVPATIELDRDAAYEWMQKGAQPTETVRSILRFKGVLYKKHLMRGVEKGALTEEQAEQKLQAWIEAKEQKLQDRRAEVAKAKEEERKKRFGSAPAPTPVSETIEEATQAVEAVASEEGMTLAEIAEAKAKAEEAANTAEEAVEEVVEEAAEVAADTTETVEEVVEEGKTEE